MRSIFFGFLVFAAASVLLLPKVTTLVLPAGAETGLLVLIMILGMALQVEVGFLLRRVLPDDHHHGN